eukprot:scaffold145780_cov19-Tisochrysis_lutea.AAC.1
MPHVHFMFHVHVMCDAVRACVPAKCAPTTVLPPLGPPWGGSPRGGGGCLPGSLTQSKVERTKQQSAMQSTGRGTKRDPLMGITPAQTSCSSLHVRTATPDVVDPHPIVLSAPIVSIKDGQGMMREGQGVSIVGACLLGQTLLHKWLRAEQVQSRGPYLSFHQHGALECIRVLLPDWRGQNLEVTARYSLSCAQERHSFLE